MTRDIRIIAIPNQEPAVRRYVLALIALVRQLQAQEEAAKAESRDQTGVSPSDDSEADCD